MVIQCADLTGVQIAALSGISRISINKILKAIRKRTADYCKPETPVRKM